MAPNVQNLSVLLHQPVSFGQIKTAPITRNYTPPAQAKDSADAYWSWETPAQHDMFSANHITANLVREASKMEVAVPSKTSSESSSYWDETNYDAATTATSDSYWNDNREMRSNGDNYWYGL